MDWQTIITGVFIAWAVGYILWRGWRMAVLKKTGGCGTCAKCPSDHPAPDGLVQIESLASSAQKKP